MFTERYWLFSEIPVKKRNKLYIAQYYCENLHYQNIYDATYKVQTERKNLIVLDKNLKHDVSNKLFY